MENKTGSSRREFLKTTGKAGIATGLTLSTLSSFAKVNNSKNNLFEFKGMGTSFIQSPLQYNYTALEPVIDATTMEIHYSKHAAAYSKNLNDACVAENVNTQTTSLENVLINVSKYSTKMRNNAGGHYNHEMYWKSMAAPNTTTLEGKLKSAIEQTFASVETFKTQFTDAGKNRFGSGWAWLVLTNDKKMIITSTPNQDNPLMDTSDLKGFPVLGLDVWEHAYYLKYQNKRADYIAAWWNVVNWEFIGKRFEEML